MSILTFHRLSCSITPYENTNPAQVFHWHCSVLGCRFYWLIIHRSKHIPLVCITRKTFFCSTELAFWSGLDRAVYPHGHRFCHNMAPVQSPERCWISNGCIHHTSFLQCPLVSSIFCVAFTFTRTHCYYHTSHIHRCNYHSLCPGQLSGCFIAGALFCLGFLCYDIKYLIICVE